MLKVITEVVLHTGPGILNIDVDPWLSWRNVAQSDNAGGPVTKSRRDLSLRCWNLIYLEKKVRKRIRLCSN